MICEGTLLSADVLDEIMTGLQHVIVPAYDGETYFYLASMKGPPACSADLVNSGCFSCGFPSPPYDEKSRVVHHRSRKCR
jgi:hypothetical protein